MHMSKAIAAAILAFCATGVLAAPLPQLAGEGAAANSILSDTDNGVGYGTENAEDKIAGNIASVTGGSAGSTGGSSSPPPPPPRKRQLAGEGAAADSILSDTDNGVGYGTENAEDKIAGNIASVTGATGSTGSTGTGSNPPPPPPRKRQLDKISAGAQAIGNAAGVGSTTAPATSAGESIDGTLTGDAANAGAEVGSTEASTLENAGSSVPKTRRQLDKISAGAQAIGNAAGVGSATAPATSAGESIDGTLTGDAANAGAEIGSTEASTLENAGSSVPKARRQLDKISAGAQAIGNAAGVGSATAPVTSAGESLDGTLTGDAANAGAEIGSTEASTLEQAGSSVPRKFRA